MLAFCMIEDSQLGFISPDCHTYRSIHFARSKHLLTLVPFLVWILFPRADSCGMVILPILKWCSAAISVTQHVIMMNIT